MTTETTNRMECVCGAVFHSDEQSQAVDHMIFTGHDIYMVVTIRSSLRDHVDDAVATFISKSESSPS